MVPTHLHQQGHRSSLVHLQNFSVLGSYQDVTVTQRDGPDGWVVLQKETCRAYVHTQTDRHAHSQRCVSPHVHQEAVWETIMLGGFNREHLTLGFRIKDKLWFK